MFGLTLRERVAEALRRGVRAAMTGAYFHHSRVVNLGLNDSAGAYLYSEALAHQIYALGLAYGRALVGKENWATPDFFLKSVANGIRESEKEQGLIPGSMVSVLLKRFVDFECLSPQQRSENEHFADSAKRVRERDARADEQELIHALEDATRKYFGDVSKMFGL